MGAITALFKLDDTHVRPSVTYQRNDVSGLLQLCSLFRAWWRRCFICTQVNLVVALVLIFTLMHNSVRVAS